MRTLSFSACLLLGFVAKGFAQESTVPVKFQIGNDRLVIQVDGQPIATYVYRDPVIPRPYFAHVKAPGGQQVTCFDQPFTFGDQEEMGIGIRVATPLSEARGGRLSDSEGHRDAREIWGNAAAWCDYSGQLGDDRIGMTLMCHPENFRPSWMHARDDGFAAANSFGRKAMSQGERSEIFVEPGESLRSRYAVWIHDDCLDGEIEQVYAQYTSAAPATPSRRPNIIVIYSDDQGYGDVSCLNDGAKFQTPNLDRLANEGIRFTNAHSADSVCTPSRYALLTGRYAWRTRLKTGVMKAEGDCLIADGRVTLASMLRDVGYQTAMVGKWHLGMQFPGPPERRDWARPIQDMPLDKGFDYFYGVPASLNYGVLAWFEGRFAKVPPTAYTAKKPNERHVDYRIMPPYQTTADEARQALGGQPIEVAPDFVDNQCLTRFTDMAIQWMQEMAAEANAGNPFFLYLPLTSPHYPVCPLPEFHGLGQCGGYGEFVIETDHHVGRIMTFLEQSGLDDNSLLIYASDNGPEVSYIGRIEEFGHHSSGPFRGGKRDVYEGGHRVPMFVRWPAGIEQPGRSWSRPVGQVDLLATIAEVVGVALPDGAGEDSQSFAPVLFDAEAEHDRLPLINHAANGRFAITDDDWKLIMPHQRNRKLELYELSDDVAESNNVAATHPEIVAKLTDKITEIICRGRTTAGKAVANDTGHWADLEWITPQQYEAIGQP